MDIPDEEMLSKLGLDSIAVDRVEKQVLAAIRAGDERTALVREIASVDREMAKLTRMDDAETVQKLEHRKKKLQIRIQKIDTQMNNTEKPISAWKDADELPPIHPDDEVNNAVVKPLTLPPKPTIRAGSRRNTSTDPQHAIAVKCDSDSNPEVSRRCPVPEDSAAAAKISSAKGASASGWRHSTSTSKIRKAEHVRQVECGVSEHPSASSSSAPAGAQIPRPRARRKVTVIDLSSESEDKPLEDSPCRANTVQAVACAGQIELYPLDANSLTPDAYSGNRKFLHKRKRDWRDPNIVPWKRGRIHRDDEVLTIPANDDANEDFYRARVRDEDLARDCENCQWIVDKKLRCPQYMWDLLYDYQRQGLQWLYQLHAARTGGVLADEMGLGKTIQIVCFLAALYCSDILQNMTVMTDSGVPSRGGVLLILPATLMIQWRDEFRTWFPFLRISIMHAVSDSVKQRQMESACDNSGIVCTTYQTFRLRQDMILSYPWVYVILDEGHQIRNPDAAITASVKKFHTPHRIILSGSPIQNNLKDLWSVLDFCAPGLLGTYPFFEGQFALKIENGARICATPKQVEEAYQCAVILRDLSAPHLLRRTKGDVMQMLQLPVKQEHLIFCHVSPEQYQVYVDFLNTDQVKRVLARRGKWGAGVPESFFCISILRKLSNHPDLLLQHDLELRPPDFGATHRSGKLKVLAEILRVWKRENHKVLIFSQTVQMLDMIQKLVVDSDYSFDRIDGKTPVKRRINVINSYNKDPDTFILLLTTRVGGVGLNIVGANRVVIFDPDWNPMVDVQARERAWRIGQTREVTVYRLITVGTVEEKMYHRQVFKHFLAQKVLVDSRQRRFFKQTDLKDLFSPPPPPPGFDPSNMHLPKRYMELFAKYRNSDQLPLETDAVLGELQLLPLPHQHTPSGAEAHEHQSLMLSLLENSSVRSEFSHDKVEQPILEERLVLHGQIHAQETLKALRDSTRLRDGYPVNAPTWTGRTGVAGRAIKDIDAEDSPRRAVGADRLGKNIEILKKTLRQQRAQPRPAKKECGSGSQSHSANIHLGDKKIAESILAYFLDKTKCPFRRACTGSILDHFNPRIPAHNRNLFKSLLKQMCILEPPVDFHPGYWRLRDEYS